MSTFSAKGSDIDVEAIMANIRRKIDDKRKGLYTEEEVREISEMKLDAVLDASEFNSDFVAAFRARDEKWNYSFGPETIYASSRPEGGGFIRFVRRLLNPVLKLFFNPNPLISALSRQSDLNRYYVLLLHNMAQEMTQMSLELTNLKARLRTLGIRVDFQTKREKTLEKLTTGVQGRDARSTSARESRESRDSGRDSGRESGRDRARDRDRDRPRDSRESRGESRDSSGDSSRRRGRGRRSYRRRRGGGSGGSSGGSGGGGGGRSGGGRSGSSSSSRAGSSSSGAGSSSSGEGSGGNGG